MTDFNSWDPIVADDRAIRAALEHANIPALMVTIAHLTGDMSLLKGSIKPHYVFGDAQMGLTAIQQDQVREWAYEIITKYRDDSNRTIPKPSIDQAREMINFLVGQSVDDDYVGFLINEIGLIESDPGNAYELATLSKPQRENFHVAVIGAGMSGIMAGFRLEQAEISYQIIEKNSDVGGTWLENSYPGCRVDTPNHSYSYSFSPNDWPQFFSSQPVLLEYFKECTSKFNIRDKIVFNTEVEQLRFDERDQVWIISVRDKVKGTAREVRANAVISAVGQLNRPKLPDIKGIDTFKGESFHTARWDHKVDLTGKRVAVIGSGASAFQVVPSIAPIVGELFIFQRTPPWVNPSPDHMKDVPSGKHFLLNCVPHYAKWFRLLQFWLGCEGALAYVYSDEGWSEPGSIGVQSRYLRGQLSNHAREYLGDDPELLSKCIPKYPPGGKRMLYDDGGWFRSLKRGNVNLVSDSITQIKGNGIGTKENQFFDVDVIIYATGFQTSKMLWPMKINGCQGVDLTEAWQDGPRAFRGVTIPRFPNLFCMYGPNTNVVVNASIIIFSECEIHYIMKCLELLLKSGFRSMECRKSSHDAYNDWIDKGNLKTAWGSSQVENWYKNEDGRVTLNWPFSVLKFWQQTRHASPEHYKFR